MPQTETTTLVEIKHRWTGAVLFSASVDNSLGFGLRLGAAVKLAVAAGVSLRDANMRDADMRDANMRSFQADIWMILSQNRAEVPALLDALRSGRVDGSTYSGSCACLVGTIANARGVNVADLECDSGRPAERWFMMIKAGDKPGDDSGGGFASAKAVEWVEAWMAFHPDFAATVMAGAV